MSNSVAFALVIAICFPSYAAFWSLTKMANDVAAQIETGVIECVPISMKYRGITLYSTWVSYAFGAVIAGVLAAILSLVLAALVTEPQVKVVACVIAAVGIGAAIAWGLNGVSELIHYRSLLREAERD